MMSTTVNGRQVNATLGGSGSITSKNESIVLTFAGGKLLIEKEKVLLNGKELAKIPAATAVIDIDYAGDNLTVAADKNRVYSGKLAP